jgi:uncharacterized protein
VTAIFVTGRKSPRRIFPAGENRRILRQDTQGRNLELRFFRDKDGREVDFVVTENRKPFLMVEAKWSDGELDKGLRYLSTRFPGVPAYQISATGKRDFVTPEGIRVCPAVTFLSTLV